MQKREIKTFKKNEQKPLSFPFFLSPFSFNFKLILKIDDDSTCYGLKRARGLEALVEVSNVSMDQRKRLENSFNFSFLSR